MPALPAQKIAIVGRLVGGWPDHLLENLGCALAETVEDSALGDVRKLVRAEITERTFRNAVLAPVAPMFAGVKHGKRRLTFPAPALGLIWRGLISLSGASLAEARQMAEADPPHPGLSGRYDRLVETAAQGLRTRANADFSAAADLCDRERPDGAASLLTCLDIAPVVRRAAAKLPIWLAHPGGESAAPARLAYNDAVAVSENAGQAYFEMIAAQLDQRWMVLRIISAVMDKPTERYLGDSELAGFAEALMDEVDEALKLIASFDPNVGAAAGGAVAARAELAVRQIMEIENNIALKRERGWGRRVHRQRLGLASAVESRLRDADAAVTQALPMHDIVQHSVRRTAPRLNVEPDGGHVLNAETLLSFSAGLRSAVNYGGFSAARGELVARLEVALDLYVDEAVQQVRSDQVGDMVFAEAFLEVAARFSDLVSGEKAGDLVRRRAQAALHLQPQNVASAQ